MDEKIADLLVNLSIAALNGDQRALRLIVATASRLLNRTFPEKARRIAEALAHKDVGSTPLRALGLEPPPRDKESGLGLVTIFDDIAAEAPVLDSETEKKVQRLLNEQKHAAQLIASGINPNTSLLLTGEPGVGKTMLASYLASVTKRRLIVLDLAGAVSSFLGKTGQNLRAVFDYARETPTVLFLDEFDSIAKRRDDPSDLGELKRIVNILLKELESWPSHSLLIAATNHPTLLDKAIWRRFDSIIEIPKPGYKERERLISKAFSGNELSDQLIKFSSLLSENMNASELLRVCNAVRRRIILSKKEEAGPLFIEELFANLSTKQKKSKGSICKLAQEKFPNMGVREIARLVNLSPSTVVHHLKGKTQ